MDLEDVRKRNHKATKREEKNTNKTNEALGNYSKVLYRITLGQSS
jgi:hypothetical protein